MNNKPAPVKQSLPNGAVLNTYPDSIGCKLSDIIELLKFPEMKDTFTLFYIFPIFFHSDLDRGFPIIDYDINEELVSQEHPDTLNELGININLDLVLNHLSVRSPQFVDLLEKARTRPTRIFYRLERALERARHHGRTRLHRSRKGIPRQAVHAQARPPILMPRFPDGSLASYWNTFYQKVEFDLGVRYRGSVSFVGFVGPVKTRYVSRLFARKTVG